MLVIENRDRPTILRRAIADTDNVEVQDYNHSYNIET